MLAALLLVLGCLALPLTASALDGSDTGENLIIPVQVTVTVLIGAALGAAMLPAGHPTARRALTGAALGLLGAAAGLVVFFLLLGGLDGA